MGEDNPVRGIDLFADQLDLGELGFRPKDAPPTSASTRPGIPNQSKTLFFPCPRTLACPPPRRAEIESSARAPFEYRACSRGGRLHRAALDARSRFANSRL